jgi:hypothetical protein
MSDSEGKNMSKWIDIHDLKRLHDKQVEKAVKIATDEDSIVDAYNKGIIAGKIMMLREIIYENCPQCGDDKLKSLFVCDECFNG